MGHISAPLACCSTLPDLMGIAVGLPCYQPLVHGFEFVVKTKSSSRLLLVKNGLSPKMYSVVILVFPVYS